MDLHSPAINRLVDEWLQEDLGRGDLTAPAVENIIGSAYWIAKQSGVFCGGGLVQKIFQRLNQAIKVKLLVEDGSYFNANQRLLELHGSADLLAAGERTALNIAMHLSGIATATAKLVKELEGTKVKLVDTRKTTPGLRVLEKYAVRCGGGTNHRLGLDDAAMLKENHIAWSGGLEDAVKAIRIQAPWPTKIIVEAETPVQAEQAIQAGADGILLDEIPPGILKELVPRLRSLASIRSKDDGPQEIVLEASGVNPVDLQAYAETGIDLISSSAPITKSSWIDFSMRFESDITEHIATQKDGKNPFKK